jgi:hypothetical protein
MVSSEWSESSAGRSRNPEKRMLKQKASGFRFRHQQNKRFYFRKQPEAAMVHREGTGSLPRAKVIP